VTPGTEAGGPAGWEVVVGLEVHCELATATKLFCGCRNAFGDEPNTNVCPVCLGLPGSLPVLNRRAVELAVRLGLALGCEVRPSIFHRKNYFYPDMPKDYQVSQYDEPLNVGGALELPGGGRVRIARAHLEEDTGKTSHAGASGRIHGAQAALVDYNRAGVPLLEIVSEPDIASAAQARAYVNELREVIVSVGASDARMEEGSLRIDANVSVRPAGVPALGTRTEVKNLNSVRSLGRAVEHEAARQAALLSAGDRVVQETRHWDEDAGRTVALRSKEEAYDYRYFPEPDLVPLEPEAGWVAAVEAGLPPLPSARRRALERTPEPGLAADEAAAVVAAGADGLVVAAVAGGVEARVAVARALNEVAGRPGAAGLDPGAFAEVLAMEGAGELTPTQAKSVLARLLEGGGSPREAAAALGYESLGDDAVAAAVEAAAAAHPQEWARYAAGEDRLAGFFVGKVMAATGGRANGRVVTDLLDRRRG